MNGETVHVVDGRGAPLSSLPRDQKIALLREHGGLVFRGFSADGEPFRALSTELGTHFYNMALDPKVREVLSTDGRVAGVIKGNRPLPLHMERGYSPLKPELVMFHMIQPSPVGGGSLLCSGARVLERMSPRLVDLFRSKRLKYVHTWEPEAWRGRYGATPDEVRARFSALPAVTDFHFDGDLLHYSYVVSAIVESRQGGRPGFCSNFLGAWQLRNRPTSIAPQRHEHDIMFEDNQPISVELFEEVQAAIHAATDVYALVANDIVLLDNYRVMHGREAFEGDRMMHTIMADADF
jgi:alpha-ketoglutarate-dependent taurine dioxygenase